jgi:hypothetical protein
MSTKGANWPVQHTTLSTLRVLLLVILLTGMLGSGVELLLINHTENILQWVPLLLLLLAGLILGWHALERGPTSTRIIRGTMLAFIVAGFAGFYLHYQGSMEFKLESNPNLTGWALFWQAVRSKAPPLLAPGAMIQLGLIGWAYTYRHPTLLTETSSASKEKGD